MVMICLVLRKLGGCFVNSHLILADKTSVSDQSHFDVDPDPGIHIWEKWIWILIFFIFYKEIHVGQITILIFVTAKI